MDQTIAAALEKFKRKATSIAENAGYSGSASDGGASQMLLIAQAFTDGWNHVIPDFLKPSIQEVNKEADPEYKTFLRLKMKFE